MDKWNMFKYIVTECHAHEGILFGGVVRDSYLHKVNERRKHKQGHSEFVVPNDVDCFISENSLSHLISMLQRRYYVRVYPDAYYMDLPPGYKFQHYSLLELTYNDAPPLIPLIIGIDFLVQSEGEELRIPELPFDVDVNLLMWDSKKIFINPRSNAVLRNLFGTDSEDDD